MKNLLEKFVKQLKKHLAPIALGLSITFGFLAAAYNFYGTPIGEREESLWYLFLDTLHAKSIDLRMRLRGTKLPQTPLAIVGIDERSLQSQGRFPWSRHKIALMVEELYKHGAKVVATDIMFSETSNDEIQRILKEIPEPND